MFNWRRAFKNYVNNLLDFLKYITKKYLYTINHKRIAINYLVFCMWSGLSGATLATMIRWELAYPGSHFFKGDSLRYLQVITTHGLTMVFFVVVPVVFGFFANFFIPYHVGSKDVAFPRLNSLGFWLLPAGYILIAKPAFLRSSFFKYFDKPSFFYQIIDKSQFNSNFVNSQGSINSTGLLS
jgi:heme/copper-type cytochrome/quinol oxidase subunit 1